MPKFEKVQLDILNSEAQNQLVSAGAGSGKTTVMIEKIANLLFEGVEVDELLVVTFTVLAAQEMKDRLIQKLKDSLNDSVDQERILSLIDKVKNASIDTIDGFSSKTIKKYFYELEITPNINIISDATKDYLLAKALKKTFDDFTKTENSNLMLDLYGGKHRDFKALKQLVLGIYNNIISLENYEGFLSEAVRQYTDSMKSEYVVVEYLKNAVEKLNKAIIENYSVTPDNERKVLDKIVQDLHQFNFDLSLKYNLKVLYQINVDKFSSRKKDAPDMSLVNRAITDFNDVKKKFVENGIDEMYEEKNLQVAGIMQIIVQLVKDFLENYNLLKKKNDYIDFNDLNRLMLKLLSMPNIREELQNKYKYIFIDEYQDVNPLQDSLMKMLAGKDSKLFMVGDVKQSIYGFRGASPEWFLDKYQNYKSNNSLGCAFDMNVNFRSSPKVLNFINDIFAKLMTKTITDIDYANDCMIEPKLTTNDQKVVIKLINNKEDKLVARGVYSVKNDTNVASDNIDKQAFLVLDTIVKLIGSSFYDYKLNKERMLTYKDIAILSRTEKDEDTRRLIGLLKNNAVPVKINNKLDVSESEGIKLVVSILSCVVGCNDDVDSLASIMALTGITIDDIIKIRDKNFTFRENLLANKENVFVAEFNKIIEEIKIQSYTKNNIELVRYILNKARVKYYLLQKQLGKVELRTIEEFLNKLTTSENNLNLAEFINLIKSSVNKSSDFASFDQEDSVTIQTIHKSKGLEYPVVILFNTGKEFSYLNEKDAINFNTEIGLGADYFDTANRIKMYSLTKFAIKIKNAEKGYKEELRLLYVALTRAKNKLYIFGDYSNKKLKDDNIKKTTYANMLLECYKDRLVDGKFENDNCVVELLEDVEIDTTVYTKEDRQSESLYLGFEYDNSSFDIPFKNSVTGINSQKVENEKFVTKKWFTHEVQYQVEEDKTLMGTQYHSALESLNFNADYQKTSYFELVDYNKIKLAHEKISKLVAGDKTHKEAEFMMYVPYKDVAGGEITDKVLVQGVVDLIIERENSIDIVDYKFSNLPIAVLKNKYSEQLRLYKQAVEQAMKKNVEHMYIYSINTGELY